MKASIPFAILATILVFIVAIQGWNIALSIINIGLISAIMALGINMQWGYAGLLNAGSAGFVALGGLVVVLVALPPNHAAFVDTNILFAILGIVGILAIICVLYALYQRVIPRSKRTWWIIGGVIVMIFAYQIALVPFFDKIESFEPAKTGNIGGLGLPVLLSWPIAALFAGLVAWGIGKLTLGLKEDYLAIVTLGVAEVIITVLKHEEWLARGVKNVTGLQRPVPFETDLQDSANFQAVSTFLHSDLVTLSTISVKLAYMFLLLLVLITVLWLSERIVHSPWGRMMRAIRDSEPAARALGKHITHHHLQSFVIGCALCGLAGAMMTTLESQFTPGSYTPLRFTFLIWVMVIIGGSGNNWGAVLGGMLVWILWIEAEALSSAGVNVLLQSITLEPDFANHLKNSVVYSKIVIMGALLLFFLRFYPKGLLPAK